MNKYCVYAHATNSGDVFYIGSGKLSRANNKETPISNGRTKRGSKYLEKVKTLNYDYSVIIIHCNLSKEDSEKLECEEYHKHLLTITNRKAPSFTKHMECGMFSDTFEICENSPTGLCWKKDTGVRGKKGTPAGSLNNTGYYLVQMNGTKYMVSRIIVLLNGSVMSRHHVVDHIDGNTKNNSVINLRVISQQDNCRNKSSKSPHPGILLVSGANVQNYIVQWYANGLRKSKQFKVIDEDFESALMAAKDFRVATIKELNSNYTSRHIDGK